MIARLSDLCWVDLLVYLLVYPFARMPRQDEDFFFFFKCQSSTETGWVSFSYMQISI